MEIPIQHDMYILANYSVFWNVLIWLK